MSGHALYSTFVSKLGSKTSVFAYEEDKYDGNEAVDEGFVDRNEERP